MFNEILLFGLIGFGAFLVLTILLWSKIQLKWLQNLTLGIVLSYPFERIPSLEIGGVNVRVSQILVLIGFYFLAILLFKKDKQLLSLKINSFWIWIVGFWITLTPSLFLAININRPLQTLIATALVFGAGFLVSNFLENIEKSLNWLNNILSLVGIFGIFQFVADFVGVPYTVTLLREHYTKRVFGFARVHATALEPLYWGGMLILPCVYFLYKIILKSNSTNSNNKILTWKEIRLDLACLSIIYLNLILTLSRGAYFAVAIAIIFSFYIFGKFIDWNKVKKFLLPFVIIIISMGGFSLILTNNTPLLVRAFDHIANTLSTKQVSANERLTFLTDALDLLSSNIISGIGSGNYGPQVQSNQPQADGGWLIVDNVYLEVWLEQGLFAFLVFVSMWIYYIWKGKFMLTSRKSQVKTIDLLALGSVWLALIGYLVQWTTFSPIFIMPVFILLGILAKITQ